VNNIGDSIKQVIDAYADHVRSTPLFLAAEQGNVGPQHVRAYLSGLLFLIRGALDVLRNAELRAAAQGDPKLAAHYRHKYAEEAGHDRWALADLKSIGATHGEPSPALTRLVAYLDDATTKEPCSLLAYILFAEQLTVRVGPAWLEVLESRCGVSRHSMSVVANHVQLDGDHVAEGVRDIDVLVPSLDKLEPMVTVVRTSISYFQQFLDEIMSIERVAA
jgi:hypothetical protein